MATESDPTRGEIEQKQVEDGPASDWYLQNLVNICNMSKLEMGITLTIGGSVISGLLIGGKKYFEIFAKEFADAWPGTNKEEIRQALAQPGAIYHTDSTAGQDEPAGLPAQYIHLANARTFVGDRLVPTNRGVLWRGKISAVSGFSLGQLSTD